MAMVGPQITWVYVKRRFARFYSCVCTSAGKMFRDGVGCGGGGGGGFFFGHCAYRPLYASVRKPFSTLRW